MAEFIVRENYSQHTDQTFTPDEVSLSAKVLHSEDFSLYNCSRFYAAYVGGQIVGSVKVTKWNRNVILPIQKLFNVDLPKIASRVQLENVWHIGRFAIARSEKDGARLLRQLITLAIYPICKCEKSMMIAECDKKFVRGLNLMGIKTELLAPGIEYLGSLTLPIYSTGNWLSDFLHKSPYLRTAKKIFEEEAAIENMYIY